MESSQVQEICKFCRLKKEAAITGRVLEALDKNA
jgi:hypothetical protein